MGHLLITNIALPTLVLIYHILLLNLPTVHANDGDVLLDFIRLADPSDSSKIWDRDSRDNITRDDYCQWIGVLKCDDQKRVVTLFLENIGFNGTLLQDLFLRLDHLEVFSLRQNKLRGTIPSLSLAKNLTTLLLDDNELSGPIPISIGSLISLKEINLSKNKLSGSLPDSPNLSNLTIFDVSNNNLTGSIPSYLARFGQSSFQGNNLLCGPPLDKICPVYDEKASQSASQSNKPFHWMTLMYIILGVAVWIGLIAVFILMYKSKRSREKHNAKFSPQSDQGSRKSNFSGNDKATKKSVERARKSSVSPVDKASRASNDSTRSKNASPVDPNKNDLFTQDGSSSGSLDDKGNLEFIDVKDKRFELDDLLKASAEILGRGLLGSSYKATFQGGLQVVVKRLSLINNCEKKAFSETMKALGKMEHPNILPLQAHLFAKEEKLLIYDYVPNGSLFNALHTAEGRRKTRLDWLDRIKIAKGVASAMDYIHTTYGSSLTPRRSPLYCSDRRFMLLHGNLKSSNILLGPGMQALVVDFGMAALLIGTGAQAFLAGNKAPECRSGGGARKLSPAADVYSYGVLLLELLTGKMPVQGFSTAGGGAAGGGLPAAGGQGGGAGVDLPQWVESVIREEWTAEVFDRDLAYSKVEEDELVSLLKLAMACVSPLLDQRPSMSLILDTFSQDIKSFREESPTQPSLYEIPSYNNPSRRALNHHHAHLHNHNGQPPPTLSSHNDTALNTPSSEQFSLSFEDQLASTTAISMDMDSLQR